MHISNPVDASWLRPLILDHIPLARAMSLDITKLTDEHVVLHAPLAPNINDKGCAFGGSIGALLTLAGWGLLTASMQRTAIKCEIYIQDSTLKYLKPAWQALDAHARIVSSELDSFVAQFRAKGRARIEVLSELYSGDVRAATMQARYVALAP
jgi:thioesterase domain-containing protein